MIKRSLIFAFAIVSALTATGLASARDATIVDVAGRHHRHRDHQNDDGISQNQAIYIAQRNGIRFVDGVQIVGGNFKVFGRDRYYRSRTVTIDPDDGEVLDIGHVRGLYH